MYNKDVFVHSNTPAHVLIQLNAYKECIRNICSNNSTEFAWGPDSFMQVNTLNYISVLRYNQDITFYFFFLKFKIFVKQDAFINPLNCETVDSHVRGHLVKGSHAEHSNIPSQRWFRHLESTGLQILEKSDTICDLSYLTQSVRCGLCKRLGIDQTFYQSSSWSWR